MFSTSTTESLYNVFVVQQDCCTTNCWQLAQDLSENNLLRWRSRTYPGSPLITRGPDLPAAQCSSRSRRAHLGTRRALPGRTMVLVQRVLEPREARLLKTCPGSGSRAVFPNIQRV